MANGRGLELKAERQVEPFERKVEREVKREVGVEPNVAFLLLTACHTSEGRAWLASFAAHIM